MRIKKGTVSLGEPCRICGEDVIALGLCWAHYHRQRRGLPLDGPVLRAKECDIPWCKKSTESRYCLDHRRRQEVWGNPLAGAPATKKAEREFWAKVQVGGASLCWPWGGKVFRPNKTGRGYGIVEHPDRHRMAYASRIAWLLGTGETVPDGMRITWSCRNSLCMNWRHMTVVGRGKALRPG